MFGTILAMLFGLIVAAAAIALWHRESRRGDRLEQEVESLRTELEEVRREARNRIDRTEREAKRSETRATWEAVETLLPAIDSLESALRQDLKSDESPGEQAEARTSESLGEGISLTLDQFETGLKTLGIERIHPSPSDQFDPDLHEALHVQNESNSDASSADDTVPEHERSDDDTWRVTECVRSGYQSEDRVLRPAGVVVESAPTRSAEQKDEPTQQRDETPERVQQSIDFDAESEDESTSDEPAPADQKKG